MKKCLLMLSLALLAVGAQAQQMLAAQRIPAAVRATFKKKFPAVHHMTWEMEKGQYLAAFYQHGTTMSALIMSTGELTETESEMATTKLPAAVRAVLARDYNAYRVIGAATLVSAAGATTYEAEVYKAGKRHDVHFNADGSLVKK